MFNMCNLLSYRNNYSALPVFRIPSGVHLLRVPVQALMHGQMRHSELCIVAQNILTCMGLPVTGLVTSLAAILIPKAKFATL